MRVGTPHSVDQALLHKVVDVLSVLDEQNIYIVLQAQGRVDQGGVVGGRALAHALEDVRLEVGPEEAAHSLDRVTDMVRRCDIDSMPAQALANDPPLLIHEVFVGELVIDLALQVPDGGLTLVLLVELGGKEKAGEGDQLDVAPEASIGKTLKVLEPRRVVIQHLRITAPAALHRELPHLGHPLLEVNAGNMRGLQLQAESDSELQYLDDGLLSQLLNLHFLHFISILRADR